jgi:drug/metabolite transporter (DMT)-like permease
MAWWYSARRDPGNCGCLLFPRVIGRATSVVVPIYGMFIVGGAVLGLVLPHEPLTLRKALGILLAAVSIYLIACHPAQSNVEGLKR